MPNLFLPGLFIGFILILGEIAIKAILLAILIAWGCVGFLVAWVYLKVYFKRLIDCRKSTTT